MSRDDGTLLDILTAARLALEFREGATRDDFLQDQKTQAAVLHQLLVIGEATKRLSEETRQAHPEIPWSSMARMRDKLIHHYEAINPAQVWQVVASDLPELVSALEAIAPPENEPE